MENDFEVKMVTCQISVNKVIYKYQDLPISDLCFGKSNSLMVKIPIDKSFSRPKAWIFKWQL